jgi:hypothetical protein
MHKAKWVLLILVLVGICWGQGSSIHPYSTIFIRTLLDDATQAEAWTTLGIDIATTQVPICISMFTEAPSRASEDNWNGGLRELDNAAAVGPATPANDFTMTTKGSGKILFVVNAGADLAGDITVTGTSVNRDTMVQTASDTSVITITGTTTDGSSTDGNGNVVHTLTKAYITDKWFTGVCVVSTSDVTISDMDIFHVSFDQFNDHSNVTIHTLDFNLFCTNVSGEFDAYLYTLHVTGDEADVHMEADLHVGSVGGAKAQAAVANTYYRLRYGSINEALDGATDGFWVDVSYQGTPVGIEDVTGKVWADIDHLLTRN